MVKNAPRLAEWTIGVGGQLGHDEDRVVGGQAARQVPGHRVADVVDLVWAAWVGGHVARGYG